MQPSNEERQLTEALDHIARTIIDRCRSFSDWGGDKPYDTVMRALHRRVLTRAQQDSQITRIQDEGSR